MSDFGARRVKVREIFNFQRTINSHTDNEK
jgi:hypothetical protein